MNTLSYDKTSPRSIFEYAIPLLDHTLREMVGDEAVEAYNMIGKGALGQMVEELYYHYKANSNPTPDFEEAGVELKTIGLKRLKDLSLQIKERLVVDMMFSALSTTNVQYTFQEILLLYTTRSQTNLLNHHICPFSTNLQANELNANIHRDSGNIAAQYQAPFSMFRASAPS